MNDKSDDKRILNELKVSNRDTILRVIYNYSDEKTAPNDKNEITDVLFSDYGIKATPEEVGKEVAYLVSTGLVAFDEDEKNLITTKKGSEFYEKLPKREAEPLKNLTIKEHQISNKSSWFEIWVNNLKMIKNSPYGDIFCDIPKGLAGKTNAEFSVKVSSQNFNKFVNEIAEIEELEKPKKEELKKAFLKLKIDAYNQAIENSSKSVASEKREELDVDREEVEKVLSKNYLVYLLKETDKVHVGDYILKTVNQCSAFSKLLTKKALNDWSVGGSGAGKTHCMLTNFATIPAEYKIKFNVCSPKSIYYYCKRYGEDALGNKIVFFNEAEASQDAIYVLRAITDTGEDDAGLLTVMDQKVVVIRITDKPVVWFTSVDPLEDEQLKNRFLFSNPEEGGEHDSDVEKLQRKNYRLGKLDIEKRVDFSLLKACFRKIVEDTADLRVIIPFNYEWKIKEDKRLHPMFVTMLNVIVKINYKNRIILDDNYIVATLDDYYLTKLVWVKIQRIVLGKLKENDLKVLELIPNTRSNAIDRGELQERSDLSYGTIAGMDSRLCDSGFIKKAKDGKKWVIWRTSKQLSKSIIQLKDESLSTKSILDFLNGRLELSIDEGLLKGVRSPTHLTPSCWKELIERYQITSKEVKTIFEREEDIKMIMRVNESLSRENEGETSNSENQSLVEGLEEDLLEEIRKHHNKEKAIKNIAVKCGGRDEAIRIFNGAQSQGLITEPSLVSGKYFVKKDMESRKKQIQEWLRGKTEIPKFVEEKINKLDPVMTEIIDELARLTKLFGGPVPFKDLHGEFSKRINEDLLKEILSYLESIGKVVEVKQNQFEVLSN